MKSKLVLSAALFAAVAVAPSIPAQGSTPNNQGGRQHRIHDANHDGVCDVCGNPVGSGQGNGQGQQAKKGRHFGPGDGTGNNGSGPRDGTGYGAQSGHRSGPRDGSGMGQAGGGRRAGRP
jgi:hypothetical protein